MNVSAAGDDVEGTTGGDFAIHSSSGGRRRTHTARVKLLSGSSLGVIFDQNLRSSKDVGCQSSCHEK